MVRDRSALQKRIATFDSWMARGKLAEWPNAPVLKTGEPENGSESSNLSLPSICTPLRGGVSNCFMERCPSGNGFRLECGGRRKDRRASSILALSSDTAPSTTRFKSPALQAGEEGSNPSGATNELTLWSSWLGRNPLKVQIRVQIPTGSQTKYRLRSLIG